MEDEFDFGEEYKEALKDVMDHRVIDGKVFISADGMSTILEMQKAIVNQIVENGQTCQHGALMAEVVIGGVSDIVESCIFMRAAEIVPDTIPDNLLGE